ncbi:hypothetical protein AAHA92_11576 [Salvia divinorum]
MALNIPQQSHFFYKRNWSPTADGILIKVLIQKKKELNWHGEIIPEIVIEQATKAIEMGINLCFTSEEINERLVFLESRYRCFKEVVKTPGTFWDFPSNIVDATDSVWKTIFTKNKLASAYYHKGEPIFNELACLFGENDVKLEKTTTVIILSETVDNVHVAEPAISHIQCSSEEVNSPMVEAKPNLRRKLFVDANYVDDEGSTTEKDNEADKECQEKNMEMKTQKKGTLRQQLESPQPYASPGGSSCASNSPYIWRR